MPCATVLATRMASISKSGSRSASACASPSMASIEPACAARPAFFVAPGGATALLQCRCKAGNDAAALLPFGARHEAQRHAVFQYGLGKSDHVIDRRGKTAFDQSLRADRQHQRLAGAGPWSPGDEPVRLFAGVRPGSRRANELQNGLD